MNRVFAKNFLSLAALHAASYLLPLVTTPYLTRVLGPGSFGNLAFSQGLIQYFSILVDFGFGLSASRAIAASGGDKARISSIYWATFNAKLILTAMSFVVMLAASLLPSIQALRSVICVNFLAVVGSWLFPAWFFQGMQRMIFISLINIAARALLIPLVFIFVHGPSDITLAALMFGSSAIFAGTLGFFSAMSLGVIGKYRFRRADILLSLRRSWPLFISSAGVSFYTAANVVMLRFVASPEQVGYFAGADKIRTASIGLITMMTTAMFPLAVNKTQGHDWLPLKEEFRAYWIKAALGFAIFVMLFFGAPIIAPIALGGKMLPAAMSLRVLAFVALIIPLNHIVGVHGLVARGFEKEFARSVLYAGIVNLVALPILGACWGAVGASSALVLAELVVFGGLIVRRHHLLRQSSRHTSVQ